MNRAFYVISFVRNIRGQYFFNVTCNSNAYVFQCRWPCYVPLSLFMAFYVDYMGLPYLISHFLQSFHVCASFFLWKICFIFISFFYLHYFIDKYSCCLCLYVKCKYQLHISQSEWLATTHGNNNKITIWIWHFQVISFFRKIHRQCFINVTCIFSSNVFLCLWLCSVTLRLHMAFYLDNMSLPHLISHFL